MTMKSKVMKKKLLIIPILLVLVLAGAYLLGIFYPYQDVNAQPSADDIIKDINLEWGEVTEDKVEIEATITLYNKFPALQIFVNRLEFSLESRGLELGEAVLEEVVLIEPISETEVKIVLSGNLDDIQSWFVQHVNNDEISTFTVTISLSITWQDVDLKLKIWVKEITKETYMLETMSEKVMERLSGKGPIAEDLIKDIQFEWGEVTEEEVKIEATILFYNKFLGNILRVNRISLSIESRGIDLGQIVSNKIITLEPASTQEEKLILTIQIENLLDWLELHINDKEVSTANISIQIHIAWINVDVELDGLTSVPLETHILRNIGDSIIDRLSGIDS